MLYGKITIITESNVCIYPKDSKRLSESDGRFARSLLHVAALVVDVHMLT